jgi:hypothetical protein
MVAGTCSHSLSVGCWGNEHWCGRGCVGPAGFPVQKARNRNGCWPRHPVGQAWRRGSRGARGMPGPRYPRGHRHPWEFDATGAILQSSGIVRLPPRYSPTPLPARPPRSSPTSSSCPTGGEDVVARPRLSGEWSRRPIGAGLNSRRLGEHHSRGRLAQGVRRAIGVALPGPDGRRTSHLPPVSRGGPSGDGGRLRGADQGPPGVHPDPATSDPGGDAPADLTESEGKGVQMERSTSPASGPGALSRGCGRSFVREPDSGSQGRGQRPPEEPLPQLQAGGGADRPADLNQHDLRHRSVLVQEAMGVRILLRRWGTLTFRMSIFWPVV